MSNHGLRGNVLVAQGGGPTAVINQSLVGVVLEAKKYPQVDRIYGALHGVEGIATEQFLDLTGETRSNLEEVAKTPASALLSTRVKPDAAYCQKMFQVMKAHDIRFFFYIGGNDSSDTVRIIKEEAKKDDYEFRAIHIPKTVDNDLVMSDHTPGYGSAARYVASAFSGVNYDNKSLGGVYIGVVMGRHAGFLTAASVLGKVYDDDGPHLVYLPERAFTIEHFINDVKEAYDKYGRCIIAVSEGIQDEEGVPIVTKLQEHIEKDAHGNVQLSGTGALGDLLVAEVKLKLGIKRVRADTLGYIQRSFLGCTSDVDQMEAREVGEKAVQYALDDGLDGSVSIVRTGHYAVAYRLLELEQIAAKTKHMDPSYINEAGNYVTEAFFKYAKPLIGSGFPHGARLRAQMVDKLIK
ncbi:MAG: ATP-dependent phosphofructokinase / diphosphate-dependent phosphofructokinase [Clostridiales bacterium]|jgi:6-phosphofructokinase 1|nr:ATP-dependent phosphofructokinase / diphosphate-dependent phosphofructokinase [Clostridiales bacterium]MDN5297574.1 ATP-dependent phosphofructokinase / diphosphate-dependent phosphofructokinase [Clostridiales bacterium]